MKSHKAKKLRASFSLLSLFEKGLYKEALDAYLHRGGITNDAILDGRKYHKKWEDEINKTNKVKIGKTEISFHKPLTEYKFYVPFNELADLSVVIDCLDAPIIYEWKTGGQSSTSYGSGYQVPFYFLACQLKGIEVNSAILVRYDQAKNEEDATIIHNGTKTIERARNYTESLVPELYKFLEGENAL